MPVLPCLVLPFKAHFVFVAFPFPHPHLPAPFPCMHLCWQHEKRPMQGLSFCNIPTATCCVPFPSPAPCPHPHPSPTPPPPAPPPTTALLFTFPHPPTSPGCIVLPVLLGPTTRLSPSILPTRLLACHGSAVPGLPLPGLGCARGRKGMDIAVPLCLFTNFSSRPSLDMCLLVCPP